MAYVASTLASYNVGSRELCSRPEDVARILNARDPGPWMQERVYVLALDSKLGLRACTTVALGTVNNCPVHPRDVWRAAIEANATGIILAHVHPSGDPRPSGEDREFTLNMARCAKLLGIALLDHVVLGGPEAWYSLRADMPEAFVPVVGM